MGRSPFIAPRVRLGASLGRHPYLESGLLISTGLTPDFGAKNRQRLMVYSFPSQGSPRKVVSKKRGLSFEPLFDYNACNEGKESRFWRDALSHATPSGCWSRIRDSSLAPLLSRRR